MIIILLDIHRNILSVQGFIRFSDYANKAQIILNTNSLYLKTYTDSSLCRHLKILMPECFLQPCTISSINCKNSREYFLSLKDNIAEISFSQSDQGSSTEEKHLTLEVTFRLQIHNNSVLENCILKSSAAVDFKYFMIKKYENFETCSIICTGCGSLITEKNINFKSVHKYFEEESDSAETWFCHKHCDQPSPELSTDCLYIGDMHFYFHNSILNTFRLSESNKSFNCMNCLSVLSLKKKMNIPYYIGFFSDKIMLKKSDIETKNFQKYKKDIAMLAFCSIIKDLLNLVDFCYIYLQSKVDEKIEVLLLQLNSQKVVQFLLHEENDDEIPCEIEFTAKEVYKVMYCVCSPDSELSKKWKHDFKVDFFQISDNMMDVVRDLLQESSKCIPNYQETVDGFSFGYLPAYVPVL